MISELRTGPVFAGDGSTIVQRSGRTGATVVADAHARFTEAVQRGNCYFVANQTGVTTQAGLSATTPVLTLFNPKGNNKNLVIMYAGATFTVAFAAASVIWLAANTNIAAADVTGTAATVRNALIGNAANPSGTALTAATLPAAPVAVSILGVGLTGAITTIPSLPAYGRVYDGSLIVAPGGALSFQTSTASGASATFAELAWEEVPI
jgi:hypothetical protein